MRKYIYYSAVVLIFAAGCSDIANVEPPVDQNAYNESSDLDPNLAKGFENLQDQPQKIEGKGLKNLKVVGELENGDAFQGMVTITSFSYVHEEEKGLLASGELRGVVTPVDGNRRTPVKQTFTDVPVKLFNGTVPDGAEVNEMLLMANSTECQILFLDIGPIFLDLLGLQVDLSQIVLDVTAVSGAGNLLGNLLCAVAGLLDGTGLLNELLGDLAGLLDQIGGLLDQINDLLGGL